MHDAGASLLAAWESFHVIVGSADVGKIDPFACQVATFSSVPYQLLCSSNCP